MGRRPSRLRELSIPIGGHPDRPRIPAGISRRPSGAEHSALEVAMAGTFGVESAGQTTDASTLAIFQRDWALTAKWSSTIFSFTAKRMDACMEPAFMRKV